MELTQAIRLKLRHFLLDFVEHNGDDGKSNVEVGLDIHLGAVMTILCLTLIQ